MDTGRRLFYIGSTIPGAAETQRYIMIGGQRWTELLYPGNQEGIVQPLFHIDMFITLAGRDDSGRGLERIGFKVVRNPLPLVYVDSPGNPERIWYFATANNALVQIDSHGNKTVWLPTYAYGNWSALSETDERNKFIWESLGFTVHTQGDFHPFADNLGAVHCIKKYLNRT